MFNIMEEANLAHRFESLATAAGMEAVTKTTVQEALLKGLVTGESDYTVAFIERRSGLTVEVSSHYPMATCCNFLYSLLLPNGENGKLHSGVVFVPHTEPEWNTMLNALAVYGYDIR